MTGLPEVLGGFDLTDQAGFAGGVPYELFARLRREAPVLRHPPGRSADGESFWVLTRYEDIVAVTADSGTFSAQGGGSRAGGGSHLDDLPAGVHAGVIFAWMNDPRHGLIKDLLAPVVVPEDHERRLRASAAELVGKALASGTVNFVDEVAEPFALRAIATLLGVPERDQAQLSEWVHGVLGFVNRRTGEVDDFSRATFQAVQQYFAELLAAKREDEVRDVGAALARLDIPAGRGEPPLTDFERVANFTVLLITGLEQPRNTIAAAVRAFAEHPRQWDRLRADPSLVDTAVEEVLRWAPPNPYNRRTATRDVTLHGARIKAGDKVTFWWPSANRDEAVFADPDVFDIGRSPNPHLAFGNGAHRCLGERFGRLEISVVLSELAARVSAIRPDGPVVLAPNNKHTVLLDLPVRLVPGQAKERQR